MKKAEKIRRVAKIKQSIDNASLFDIANYLHFTHKNNMLSFAKAWFLLDIYKDKNRNIVIMKATQCFHPDTRILTEKGYIKISEISVGDKVLTKDSGFQKVKKIFINKSIELLRIKAEGMDDLLVTPDHPMFSYKKDIDFKDIKLKPIKECKVGDFLIQRIGLNENIAVRIKKIETLKYSGPVNNLHIENDNTYIANGYIVHNCGISEYLIVRVFYRINKGKSLLYILPTFDLKNQFVKERFDKSIYYTKFYQQMFTEGDNKMSESMSLKQTSRGTVAFAGSNTPNAFISFPADDIIIDEVDNCDQENLIMVSERQSASTDKTTIRVGNPTILNFGIDKEYRKSDQKKWWIKHDCGNWIQPDFFTHIIQRDGEYDILLDDEWDKVSGPGPRAICQHCGKPFDRFQPGEWVSEQKSDISGYHVSKMFSTQVTTKELVDKYEEGLSNDTIMQRFYNGDLGLAYASAGAKIQMSLIQGCISDYSMIGQSSGLPAVMGVDVGKRIHIIIIDLLPSGMKRLVFAGAVQDEIEVEYLWRQYNCKIGVIDALPETRVSKKLCTALPGMFMSIFQFKVKDMIDIKAKLLRIDRTQSIDAVKECLFKKEILLPRNIETIPEFCEHLQSSTRILNERRECYEWIESGPDHLLLALAYCLKAEKLIKMI